MKPLRQPTLPSRPVNETSHASDAPVATARNSKAALPNPNAQGGQVPSLLHVSLTITPRTKSSRSSAMAGATARKRRGTDSAACTCRRGRACSATKTSTRSSSSCGPASRRPRIAGKHGSQSRIWPPLQVCFVIYSFRNTLRCIRKIKPFQAFTVADHAMALETSGTIQSRTTLQRSKRVRPQSHYQTPFETLVRKGVPCVGHALR